jgi:hypothetical protein
VVQHCVVVRLNAKGLLGAGRTHAVVLGLDESALQEDNSLGYVGFMADRETLWRPLQGLVGQLPPFVALQWKSSVTART